MKTLNLEKIITMKPTRRQIDCAKTLFMAMAHEQCVRERIEPIEKFCLELIKAKNKRTGEPITNPDHSYRMSDEQYKEYREEVLHDMAKIGYTSDRYQKQGYCPLLEAENLTLKAKQALIYAMEDVTGIEYGDIAGHLDIFKEYIDLTLRYLASYVK